MKNSYLNVYRRKSDSELESISVNVDGYITEAREAAIQVLRERKEGLPVEEVDEEPEISSVEDDERISDPETEGSATYDGTQDPDAPELYSKTVITAFAVLFSTIFGAALLMQNMKRTNNTEGRWQVLFFGIAYTFTLGMLIEQFNLGSFLGIAGNYLGALILNEYFWNKYIGKELRFRKRSWYKAALISVLITIPLVVLLIYQMQ